MVAARNAERLASLAEEINGKSCPLDATRFEQVDACVQQTIDWHGRVDGIACCIGSLLLKPANQTSEAEFLATIAANLTQLKLTQ